LAVAVTALLGLEARRYDDPVVQRLVAEVQAEYVVRYGGPDRAVVDPAEFAPPHGLFLVGLADAVPLACGGWRVHEDPVGGVPTVEIKRMYVASTARRRGLARLVLAELERTAASAGHRAVVLNTGYKQPEAVNLYESCGYHEIPGYGLYRDTPGAFFYGKLLDGADGDGTQARAPQHPADEPA
jgi:GNAT superfamily N-acetyltransferase